MTNSAWSKFLYIFYTQFHAQAKLHHVFEALLHGSIFDKTAFYLEEKQGMLVNNECSSWCNTVSDFLVSVWDGRKQLFCIDGAVCMPRQNNPTPECVVNGTEYYDSWVSAIYLFIYWVTQWILWHVITEMTWLIDHKNKNTHNIYNSPCVQYCFKPVKYDHAHVYMYFCSCTQHTSKS